jgi:hypothetical protein
MAFSILAFVSNRETLKKSWRNKGEMWMRGMHVDVHGGVVCCFLHLRGTCTLRDCSSINSVICS